MTAHRLKVAVLFALSAAAALGGSLPAIASAPDVVLNVRITPNAAVQARGAGVVVTVKARCPVGQTGYVSAETTQAHPDGTLTSGLNGAPLECTGETQVVRVPIIPLGQTSDELVRPFEPGSLFVSATLGVCTDTCSTHADTRTVDAENRRINRPAIDDPLVTMSLPAEASLEGEGAGVVVTVEYTCAAGLFGGFDASIAQLTSPGVVQNGFDSLQVTCTSQARSGVLAFHAEAAAWTDGSAFIVLNGQGCADGDCTEVQAFRTLKVA